MTPLLLLVSGPPGAGKTTFSRRLAAELSLPLVAKDALKEMLADALGCPDLASSRRIGRASIAVFWTQIETLLAAGVSVIAEKCLREEWDARPIAEFQEKYGARTAQVYVTTPPEILLTRIAERTASGERHACHWDLRMDEMADSINRKIWTPLDIAGPTLTLDTSDFDAIDFDAACEWAARQISGIMDR